MKVTPYMPKQTQQKETYSIKEFCKVYGIGVNSFYNLKDDGKAPRFFKVGTRVLISKKAADEWMQKMEEA